MEAKEFMELFDSCWFEMEILKKQSRSNSDPNPVSQIKKEMQKSDLFRVPTTISRSMSDQLWPNKSCSSDLAQSPDSVLLTAKLRTILSGKEIIEEEEEASNLIQTQTEIVHAQDSTKKKAGSRRKGKKTMSKSLSELEFEELKGFMDLGFVFSEEDKDSSLVSIIPGLQRLGKKDGEEESNGDGEGTVSRPYLSEAWEDLDRKRKAEPLVNWRIPSLNNEIDMKVNLKFWAQTVASAVR